MACDLSTTQAAACESGIGKLDSPIELLKVIAQLSCEIADAGSGGGTPGGGLNSVQFNDGGAFGGFGSYNSGTGLLTLTGNLTVPSVTGNLTGNVTGSSSLNVLKAGDTMTGLLTIAQATANTSNLALTGYSLTGANAQSMMSLAGTWNTTGTPSAITLAITDTASNANSMFASFSSGAAGATGVLRIYKNGSLSLAGGGITVSATAGTFVVPAANQINLDGGAGGTQKFSANIGGVNLASTMLLNWSSTTSAQGAKDVGFSRNAAGIIEVNTGAAGTFRDLWARHLRLATAFTVATLPAAGVQGRMAYVTDSLAPAFGAIVAGGGAVVIPVFDDGTNWRVG